MSLAGIIANGLAIAGVTFKKGGEELPAQKVANIIKDEVCVKLLTPLQGGISNKQYFCDKCAQKIKSG